MLCSTLLAINKFGQIYPQTEIGTVYRVSQKKRNGGFSVPCELKVLYIFTSLDKTTSAEENDTKIVKFGWVIWSLCTLLEIQSFSNFAGFLGPMSEEFCRDKQSIRYHVEAHCSVFLLLPQINGLPQNTVWKVCPATILHSPVAKSSEIWKWPYFKKWS